MIRWLGFIFLIVLSTEVLGQSNAAQEEAELILQNIGHAKPEVLRELQKALLDRRRALVRPLGFDVAGRIREESVSLVTDGRFIEIRVAPTEPTVVSFFDNRGVAWPVEHVVGDQIKFDIQRPTENGNQFVVAPLEPLASGTLQVFLKALSLPISLRVRPPVKKIPFWDEQLSVLLEERAPGVSEEHDITETGRQLVFDDLPSSELLRQFFSPNVPRAAIQKAIEGDVDASVWEFQDKYIVLAKANLVFPPVISRLTGTGGRTLSVINKLRSIVFFDVGQEATLKVLDDE